MLDPQEEEGATGQENPRRGRRRRRTAGAAARTDDELTVSVPFDDGRRIAVRRALQRHRIVTGHGHVRWMLRDPRRFAY